MDKKFLLAKVDCSDDFAPSPDLFVLGLDGRWVGHYARRIFWLRVAARIYALPEALRASVESLLRPGGRDDQNPRMGLSRTWYWWWNLYGSDITAELRTEGDFLEAPDWQDALPLEVVTALELRGWTIVSVLPRYLSLFEEDAGLRGHRVTLGTDESLRFTCYNKWSGDEFFTPPIPLSELQREVLA